MNKMAKKPERVPPAVLKAMVGALRGEGPGMRRVLHMIATAACGDDGLPAYPAGSIDRAENDEVAGLIVAAFVAGRCAED